MPAQRYLQLGLQGPPHSAQLAMVTSVLCTHGPILHPDPASERMGILHLPSPHAQVHVSACICKPMYMHGICICTKELPTVVCSCIYLCCNCPPVYGAVPQTAWNWVIAVLACTTLGSTCMHGVCIYTEEPPTAVCSCNCQLYPEMCRKRHETSYRWLLFYATQGVQGCRQPPWSRHRALRTTHTILSVHVLM